MPDAPTATPMVAVRLRGPRGRPLVGNIGEFSRDQLGFYTRCVREYGDVVPVRLGSAPGLMVYHPDAIEEVLVTRNRDFIKSRGGPPVQGADRGWPVRVRGRLWLRQRRLMQPAFHRQRIAAYGEIMAAFAARHVAGWRAGAMLDMQER